jgi:hypothetical protein
VNEDRANLGVRTAKWRRAVSDERDLLEVGIQVSSTAQHPRM